MTILSPINICLHTPYIETNMYMYVAPACCAATGMHVLNVGPEGFARMMLSQLSFQAPVVHSVGRWVPVICVVHLRCRGGSRRPVVTGLCR